MLCAPISDHKEQYWSDCGAFIRFCAFLEKPCLRLATKLAYEAEMKQKPKKNDADRKERQHLTDPEHFSEVLRAAREASGRSVRALAREIGCGATILRRMESGEPSIQVEVFLKASEILGLRLEDFVRNEAEPSGARHENEFWLQVRHHASRDLAGFLSRVGEYAQSTASAAHRDVSTTNEPTAYPAPATGIENDPDAQRIMAVLWDMAQQAVRSGKSPSPDVTASVPGRVLAEKSHIAVKTAYRLLEELVRERYIEP